MLDVYSEKKADLRQVKSESSVGKNKNTDNDRLIMGTSFTHINWRVINVSVIKDIPALWEQKQTSSAPQGVSYLRVSFMIRGTLLNIYFASHG